MNKRKFLIILSIFFSLIIIVLVGVNKKLSESVSSARKTTRTDSTNKSNNVDGEEIVVPQDELDVIKYSEKSLKLIAEKSPSAKILYNWYNKGKVYAKYKGTNALQVVNPATKRNQFYVTANPHNLAKKGDYAAANFHCDFKMRLMVLNKLPSRFSSGMIFAHEIVHLVDCLRGEPPTKPLSLAWLIGERNAHLVVRKILDEYTKGKYLELVKRSIERRLQYIKSQGASSTAAIFSVVPGDVEDIKSVFKGIDETGVNFVGIQLIVDANLIIATNHYGTNEAGHRATISLLHQFYSRSAFLKH